MDGKTLTKFGSPTDTVSNGVYTVTCSGQYDGYCLPTDIFENGKTYILSYKVQKTSGNLIKIGGHSQAATQKIFNVDGKSSSNPYHYDESTPNITDDTNTHTIEFKFAYSPNETTNPDKNIYIQPNRMLTTSVTIKISEVSVYEVVDEYEKNYLESLGTLPTVTRKGYTSLGWYTNEINGTDISSTTTVPANDVQYYVHWLSINLMNGKTLTKNSSETDTVSNGIYTITRTVDYGGYALPLDIFTIGKTYVLNYKLQKISGKLVNTGGHAQAAVQKSFTIDGQSSSNAYGYSGSNSNITDDTAVHDIEFKFTYNSSGISDSKIYIQPNRGCASSNNVTVKISEILVYETSE